MTETVNLDSKDLRAILAKFFGVDEKQIIPNRYTFSISGLSAAEVQAKIEGK